MSLSVIALGLFFIFLVSIYVQNNHEMSRCQIFTSLFIGYGPCLGTFDKNIKKYTWLTYNQVKKSTKQDKLHLVFDG